MYIVLIKYTVQVVSCKCKGGQKRKRRWGSYSMDDFSKTIQYVIDWIENYFVRL